MNAGTENNARVYVHLTIVALVLVVFVAGVEHILPYDVPAATMAATIALPVTAQPAAPANCLPSGGGGPCIPFDQLIQQMQNTPEVIPANPAAVNEETI
jgi:hypothetical protein